MKRYGIFVFYDPQGVVKNYVVTLLQSLVDVVDTLTIIINGEICPSSYLELEKYADFIFQRENVGFDAGAYKDAFCQFLMDVQWENYDEIILLNDTFYGPFYPWENVFRVFESKEIDFWGLSRYCGEQDFYIGGEKVTEHIQSYFLSIRKNMFRSNCFRLFWEELDYPKTLESAIANFEIAFTKYFVGKGYSFGTLMDVLNEENGQKINAGYRDFEEAITRRQFPILKRKVCGIHNYVQLKNVFHYIHEETTYPISCIKEDMESRVELKITKPYNPNEVLVFCNTHEKIYLYGYGKVAKNLTVFLEDNGITVEGYVITKKTQHDEAIHEFADFELPIGAGMIVALNKQNTRAIYEAVREKYRNGDVFWPK